MYAGDSSEWCDFDIDVSKVFSTHSRVIIAPPQEMEQRYTAGVLQYRAQISAGLSLEIDFVVINCSLLFKFKLCVQRSRQFNVTTGSARPIRRYPGQKLEKKITSSNLLSTTDNNSVQFDRDLHSLLQLLASVTAFKAMNQFFFVVERIQLLCSFVTSLISPHLGHVSPELCCVVGPQMLSLQSQRLCLQILTFIFSDTTRDSFTLLSLADRSNFIENVMQLVGFLLLGEAMPPSANTYSNIFFSVFIFVNEISVLMITYLLFGISS